jgi:hypothetical protein
MALSFSVIRRPHLSLVSLVFLFTNLNIYLKIYSKSNGFGSEFNEFNSGVVTARKNREKQDANG